MNTTTPPRLSRPQTTSATSNLQSTPQSVGTASRSEGLAFTGVKVNDVNPWITRDVEKAQKCEVDEMLKSFLLDCMVDELLTMDDMTVVLDKCLDIVLPICDGNFSKGGCDSSMIRSNLMSFSEANKEVDSYRPFVCAANAALACLWQLGEIEGLRRPCGKLVFHYNDQKMWQDHQGGTSTRKPDVVLVSDAEVEDCCELTSDDKMYFGAPTKKPVGRFIWRTVRTVVEFKKASAPSRPPVKYAKGGYVDPPNYRLKYLSLRPSNDKEPTKTQNNSRKRRSATPEYPSSQRSGSSSKRQKVENRELDPNKVYPIAQVGMYAAEMFASHLGRRHVICLIVVGQLLYVWRYDRQGAIECAALNIVEDLPRFLVLLFTMQRFQNFHWGLNPKVDPDFGQLAKQSSSSQTTASVHLDDPEVGPVDITLDLSSPDRVTHYGLSGRATNVCPAVCPKFESKGKLVAKLFWSEESRISEPDILKRVYEIAETNDDVKDHVPDMVFFHVFSASSTATIRERLGLPHTGSRILYLILFRFLTPITKLTGDPFLNCWWDAVKCHLALWKNGVCHRDVSASNLMSRGEGNNAGGVLNDFDLATLAVKGPTGNERTGTVPFMALDLLTEEGLAGELEHVYAYDAESFLWVLTWISLRYGSGNLCQEDRVLDEWLKVDALTCGMHKLHFLHYWQKRKYTAGRGHERNWEVAMMFLKSLLRQKLLSPEGTNTPDNSYEVLLYGPLTTFMNDHGYAFPLFRF